MTVFCRAEFLAEAFQLDRVALPGKVRSALGDQAAELLLGNRGLPPSAWRLLREIGPMLERGALEVVRGRSPRRSPCTTVQVAPWTRLRRRWRPLGSHDLVGTGHRSLCGHRSLSDHPPAAQRDARFPQDMKMSHQGRNCGPDATESDSPARDLRAGAKNHQVASATRSSKGHPADHGSPTGATRARASARTTRCPLARPADCRARQTAGSRAAAWRRSRFRGLPRGGAW